jgi:hypothetical protein
MDFALQQNFSPPYLKAINDNRIFLQVITLSNISSTDGKNSIARNSTGPMPQGQA